MKCMKKRIPNHQKIERMLDYIVQYKVGNDGLYPTIKMIMENCEVSSTSMVRFYTDHLIKQGRLVINHRIVTTKSIQTPLPKNVHISATSAAFYTLSPKGVYSPPASVVFSGIHKHAKMIYQCFVDYKVANDGIAPTVREMAHILSMSQTNVDYHRKSLVENSLLLSQKRGRILVYTIPEGKWEPHNKQTV